MSFICPFDERVVMSSSTSLLGLARGCARDSATDWTTRTEEIEPRGTANVPERGEETNSSLAVATVILCLEMR